MGVEYKPKLLEAVRMAARVRLARIYSYLLQDLSFARIPLYIPL